MDRTVKTRGPQCFLCEVGLMSGDADRNRACIYCILFIFLYNFYTESFFCFFFFGCKNKTNIVYNFV